MSSTAGARPRRPRRPAPPASRSSHDLAMAAAHEALKKKGEDIVLLDLRTLTGVCDYFVIVSAGSDTQVRAIADQVVQGLDEQGSKVWHVEGYPNGRWVLCDFVDVVVHVFHQETRGLYQLERLWADAGKERLGDD